MVNTSRLVVPLLIYLLFLNNPVDSRTTLCIVALNSVAKGISQAEKCFQISAVDFNIETLFR